jgi:hypothetical protein
MARSGQEFQVPRECLPAELTKAMQRFNAWRELRATGKAGEVYSGGREYIPTQADILLGRMISEEMVRERSK